MRSESESEEEARSARASLNAIPGIGDINAELLYQWGFRSSEQLAEANENNFEVEGITPERARQVIQAAREWVANKRRIEGEKVEAAAAAAREAAESGDTSGSMDAAPEANSVDASDGENASSGQHGDDQHEDTKPADAEVKS